MQTIDPTLTRDGAPISRGEHYHLLARLADPLETVEVVGFEPDMPSILDGQPMIRFVVRSPRGTEFIVEPWQLSRIPPDELYRSLRRQSGEASPLRLPLSAVRLSA